MCFWRHDLFVVSNPIASCNVRLNHPQRVLTNVLHPLVELTAKSGHFKEPQKTGEVAMA
jgi:hypothetical protein